MKRVQYIAIAPWSTTSRGRIRPQFYGYKAEKVSIDTELDRLNQVNALQIKEVERLSELKAKNDEMHAKAESASVETTLTRSLADALISKICVYPGNRVEIVWKVAGFGEATK